MSAIWRSLLRDERGFVITAELVLISTVLILGLVAALSAVKVAIAGELGEVAGSIGSLNQSYYTNGFHGGRSLSGVVHARTYGSAFLDREDSTDEQEADFATATGTSSTTHVVVTPKAPCNAPACVNPRPSCSTPGYVVPFPVPFVPFVPAPFFGSSFATSVPPVICPPGPGPFTGTDPFAPGAVSPQNMLLQGVSYDGVCAPPSAPSPPTQSPAAQSPSTPCPMVPCPTTIQTPAVQTPAVDCPPMSTPAPECCGSTAPAPQPCAVY